MLEDRKAELLAQNPRALDAVLSGTSSSFPDPSSLPPAPPSVPDLRLVCVTDKALPDPPMRLTRKLDIGVALFFIALIAVVARLEYRVDVFTLFFEWLVSLVDPNIPTAGAPAAAAAAAGARPVPPLPVLLQAAQAAAARVPNQ